MPHHHPILSFKTTQKQNTTKHKTVHDFGIKKQKLDI